MISTKIPKHALSTAEYQSLCVITRKTKTDCWFYICTDRNGIDYVQDLENGSMRIEMSEALQDLYEAIVSIDDLVYNLNIDPLLVSIFLELLYEYEIIDKTERISLDPIIDTCTKQDLYNSIYDNRISVDVMSDNQNIVIDGMTYVIGDAGICETIIIDESIDKILGGMI